MQDMMALACVHNSGDIGASAPVLGQRVPYPHHLTILDLFERQVAIAPHKVAVTYASSRLTYEELNHAADVLAARLAAFGVMKGAIVPVAIANSIELPAAWLALIKLGAVFVPLDPEWPADRLATLVRMIAPPVVLVDSDRVSYPCPPLLVFAPSLTGEAAAPPPSRLSPNDLIYGFFTSGSTGAPKCALNTHRGLMNRFCFMTRRFSRLGPKVTLQNSRHVFDSSLWQLLWPLTEGGEVVIPEITGRLDLLRTIALIERHSVTMTDFVPSIFNRLVHLLQNDRSLAARLRSLRELLLGGETINAVAVRRFQQLVPNVGITNTYGPTEAAIGMVFHQVSPRDGDEIPLGAPIDNTYLVVLDQDRQPVPPGVTGEIYIGGDCLGTGYLNDPAMTDAAFVANPFSTIPGPRIYRTGDLGYWRQDGLVHFCGRIDEQAKIAGVRIELSEIDHALLKHPSVKEAATIAVTQHDGSKALVAAVVSAPPVGEGELLKHLSSLIPKDMLPRQTMALASLPLTANGKLDRRALEAMYQNSVRASASQIGATQSIEDHLLRLFRTILQRPSLSLDDDFFECGGDSLLALDLALAVQAPGRANIEVADIYSAPTARALARRVGEESPRTTCRADWDAEVRRHVTSITYSAHETGSKAVLLTGGTGFVGAHILADLLRDPSRVIYCLVRADSSEQGSRRLQAALAAYELFQPEFKTRMYPVTADLASPRLGLSQHQWSFLADEVDAIVHAAAMVDFLHDYERHSRVNTVGTAQILSLAGAGRPKQLHHISTLGVCRRPSTHDGTINEADPLSAATISDSGYGQSKWVAEQLVRDAQTRGLDATIHRLGEVGPSTVTNIPNPRSFLHILLRVCASLRAYPATKLAFDWIPADAVASFIACALARGESAGKTFHVFDRSGCEFQTLCQSLARHGVHMNAVPDSQFVRLLEGRAANGSREQRQLAMILAAGADQLSAHLRRFVYDASTYFSNSAFASFVAANNISLPSAREILIPHLGRAYRDRASFDECEAPDVRTVF